jgi:hypothetical protein
LVCDAVCPIATILANGTPVPASVHSPRLALDHPGRAIYAIPASRRDGFTKARIHPHPEAAVRISYQLTERLTLRRPSPTVITGPGPGDLSRHVLVEMAGHGALESKPVSQCFGQLVSLFRIAVPLLLALSGCHLLDQTDFEPRLARKPPPPPVPDPETRPALVTIDFAKAEPDYRAGLAAAIQAVETRRPGTLYDVVAVVPDAASADSGRARAAGVMIAIEADGVIAPRIQLGLALDPGRKIPQVRVYLR